MELRKAKKNDLAILKLMINDIVDQVRGTNKEYFEIRNETIVEYGYEIEI